MVFNYRTKFSFPSWPHLHHITPVAKSCGPHLLHIPQVCAHLSICATGPCHPGHCTGGTAWPLSFHALFPRPSSLCMGMILKSPTLNSPVANAMNPRHSTWIIRPPRLASASPTAPSSAASTLLAPYTCAVGLPMCPAPSSVPAGPFLLSHSLRL